MFADDEAVYILLHVSPTSKEQDYWGQLACKMSLNYTSVNNSLYYKTILYNVIPQIVDIYCFCRVKFFHVVVSQY